MRYYEKIENIFFLANVNNERFEMDHIGTDGIVFTKESTELDNNCFSSVFELLETLGIKKYRVLVSYEAFTMFLTIEADIGEDREE